MCCRSLADFSQHSTQSSLKIKVNCFILSVCSFNCFLNSCNLKSRLSYTLSLSYLGCFFLHYRFLTLFTKRNNNSPSLAFSVCFFVSDKNAIFP